MSRLLTDLEELLQSLVDDPTGIVPPELAEDLGAAWREVQPLFNTARDALAGIDETAWIQAGLTGAELIYKMGAASYVIDRARAELGRLPRVPREAAGALASACGLVDAILKSLPVPIPERLEEFKSVTEKLAEAAAFVVEGG